jgi:hypothetical protein
LRRSTRKAQAVPRGSSAATSFSLCFSYYNFQLLIHVEEERKIEHHESSRGSSLATSFTQRNSLQRERGIVCKKNRRIRKLEKSYFLGLDLPVQILFGEGAAVQPQQRQDARLEVGEAVRAKRRHVAQQDLRRGSIEDRDQGLLAQGLYTLNVVSVCVKKIERR